MIEKLIQYFNSNNVPYVILSGYDQTKPNSDIDILIKPSTFKKINSIIEEFCSRNKVKVSQILHHDHLAKNFYLYHNNSYLNLDFYGIIKFKNVNVFKDLDPYSVSRIYKNLNILSYEHEFYYYVIKKIQKKNISKVEFDKLYLVYANSDINKLFDLFRRYLDLDVITRIILNLEQKNYNLFKNLISSNIETPKKRTFVPNEIIRVFNRIISPTGLSICFLGPDGVGKSYLINSLHEENLPFRDLVYCHLKPYPKKRNTMETNHDPGKSQPYSFFLSSLKLTYFFFIFIYGWYINILPELWKSKLVIFDRYIYDIQIDPKRFRLKGLFYLKKFLIYVVPKPEITFILKADPELIYKRKKELTIEEIENQLTKLDNIKRKGVVYLDGGSSKEDLLKKIKETISEYKHDQFRRSTRGLLS